MLLSACRANGSEISPVRGAIFYPSKPERQAKRCAAVEFAPMILSAPGPATETGSIASLEDGSIGVEQPIVGRALQLLR